MIFLDSYHHSGRKELFQFKLGDAVLSKDVNRGPVLKEFAFVGVFMISTAKPDFLSWVSRPWLSRYRRVECLPRSPPLLPIPLQKSPFSPCQSILSCQIVLNNKKDFSPQQKSSGRADRGWRSQRLWASLGASVPSRHLAGHLRALPPWPQPAATA